MTKIQGSEHLRPRLRVSDRWPYICMDVMFRAVSARESGERRWSVRVGSTTLTSKPVSTRRLVLVCMSVMKLPPNAMERC